MFGSVQVKQEYNTLEDNNHQTLVSVHGDDVDCNLFENQNVQYAYHSLPNLWDQALHVQTNQYPKDFSHKNEVSCRQDMPQMNSPPSVHFNYLTQMQQQQQQQHLIQPPHQNTFAVDQSNNQLMQQSDQSNIKSVNLDIGAQSSIGGSNALVDSAFLGIQSNSVAMKSNNSSRSSKSTDSTSPGKKVKCQCEICFKEFGHKSNLFIHMRTHNGERPYKCKECNKSFTHSGNLAIHMRTHSGERPYACQVCGKMFSHSGNLSTHLRTHSGVKPYKCSICQKEFRHSGNLSIHERIHSGIKPFQCSVCGKEFYHSGNLTTHMKKHPVIVPPNQCKNNTVPSLSTNYAGTNVNHDEEIGRIIDSSSVDVNGTMQNPNKMEMQEQSSKELMAS